MSAAHSNRCRVGPHVREQKGNRIHDVKRGKYGEMQKKKLCKSSGGMSGSDNYAFRGGMFRRRKIREQPDSD